MIILRLYDALDSVGLIDILHNNDYKHIHDYYDLDVEIIKKDVVNALKKIEPISGGYLLYYIEINEENKTYGIKSEWVDKTYIRSEKLKIICEKYQ
jgi:hypothetical protein